MTAIGMHAYAGPDALRFEDIPACDAGPPTRFGSKYTPVASTRFDWADPSGRSEGSRSRFRCRGLPATTSAVLRRTAVEVFG
jgi:hypothetical protein